ncbi:hypothetical protein D3C71_1720960 [compost metagenome]
MAPALGSINLTTQRATVDLPDPDSPTTPAISPRLTVKATSLAAATTRAAPKKGFSL